MTDEHQCELSVVVPAYNAEEFIAGAIESVLVQIPAGRDLEIIVVDDGSTDGTVAVVEGLGSRGPVICIRQENGGPSTARNRALEVSRGRNLMLLDADDELCPGCVETTLDFMERHPDVGMFFTNYDIYDSRGVVTPSGVDLWRRFRGLAHDESRPGEWVFTEPLAPHIVEAGGFMHTSGLTISRAAFQAVGGFREGFAYGEDDEFYARVAHTTRVGYVDRVLSRKRNHTGSLIHDPANRLRNATHLLELAEIQLDHYRDDEAIAGILRRKIPELVVSLGWLTLQAGRPSDTRALLRRYMSSYPGCFGLYRLWARSWLAR